MCYITCYVTCYIGTLQRQIFHVIFSIILQIVIKLYMTTLLLYTYIDNTYIICSIICYIRNIIKVTTTWLYSS